MQYPRIYHTETLSINKIVQLSDNAARHIGLVLRLSVGDRIILFNGDGVDYLSEITESHKKKINVKIIELININRESVLSIHLGQAVSRSEKMDWVIQKAVELGVNEITPVISQYTVAKASPQKLEHWKKIMISACEQCGRNKIPVLHSPVSLFDWVSKTKIQCGLIFDPEATKSLKDLDCFPLVSLGVAITPAYLLIGPEGGFSSDEIKLSQQYNFQSIKLGNRILRTETAAIAAISALQVLFGDFR